VRYWDEGRPGVGAWLLMVVMMLVFWGGLVAVGYAIYRSARTSGPPKLRSSDARGMLDERLARGEIEPEDYQRRRELIESGPMWAEEAGDAR
jgi:putative membrane protein